ncbi:lactate racemase domain-containing protein [Microlunatus soli]|uniref:Nickel-dependent lactate racemase n=1 Tax=Microlunatus soli TaxID=630515 RepID=A0A1H1MIM0_9ACTN|nr:lactate racemase domain-containing protein [Microlunatus soli]SDR86497.1 Nickel-dependent lactate racemase [Microlunatus soli]
MTTVRLEYGDGHLDAELPDDAIEIRAGQSGAEPDPLPDPVAATREAVQNPVGMPRLDQLVGPRSKITIAFPDRVKGGVHDSAHRRVAVPLLLDELERAGVSSRDVTLVCAIGLHRKNTEDEFAALLGDDTLSRLDPSQIVNHDAEDPDQMVDIGTSRHGDPVQMNRRLLDADLSIMLGHTSGNPYGGYSGGYKMPATGLTSWRSIRSHHSPGTMQRPDFVPASTDSHFRHQLQAIGRAMEAAMPRPFFTVDAVLDAASRQLKVAAGAIAEVEQATWPTAGRRTELVLDGPPADVLVVGMPRNFHYGNGMGSNPILMMQAAGSSISRAKNALRADPVIIVASVCDGWFNDDEFPATVAVYDALQTVDTAADLTRFEDEFSTRTDWVEAYRHGGAYHPFHAFSMAYMGGLAKINSRSVIIAGAQRPDLAHGMGAATAATVEEALADAGALLRTDPRVLVVPELSKPAYHLSIGR